jgi:hypothetical protein
VPNLHSTYFWRAWHDLDGSTYTTAMAKWVLRRLTCKMPGKSSRGLFSS